MRRLLSRVPRSILAMRARTALNADLQATFGDAAAFCVLVDDKGASLDPSGHCDDHCPPCHSGSGAHCAEGSRSSGADRRRCRLGAATERGAPSLEFSERVEPRFRYNDRGPRRLCAARQSKVRSGPPRGVGYADRQVVLARPLHRPLASSFGRPPSPTRNLSVHRPMNDSPEPHVFEEQRNKLRPDSHHDKAEP